HGPHVTAWALFLTFSQITLSGFGGMVFWARRVLVERRHWLTEQEFVDLLALGQLLPGPNVRNVTVMVGDRCAGWAGAAAAVTGFLVVFGRNNPSPYTVNGRPLSVHLNGLAIVLLK